MRKLPKQPYKGVRDFYPEDKAVQEYIFSVWRDIAESFGYVEYDASILEPAELYRVKSGEEIIHEQTYTFTDRGDREVTLRPEMTPTVARMVAARVRELPYPLRWYSIPNLFRYERPQRGRLREHWQLNTDIFGVEGIEAEVETITIASEMMNAFGIPSEKFEIRINDRILLEKEFKRLKLDQDTSRALQKLLDKKDKIDDFDAQVEKLLGTKHDFSFEENEAITNLKQKLADRRITNVVFTPTLVRGFDYYTGIVFEVFDTHPDNNRSLFGGGRYDNLLDIFGVSSVPACGFGMGDVTIRDTLEVYGFLPEYVSPTDVMICIVEKAAKAHADTLAAKLRDGGVNVAVNYSDKKVGDQIKMANKSSIPFVVCVGPDEVGSETYTAKELSSGEEHKNLDLTALTELLIDSFIDRLES